MSKIFYAKSIILWYTCQQLYITAPCLCMIKLYNVFHNYKCTLYSIVHSSKRWILQNVKGIWEFFFIIFRFFCTDLKRKKTRLNKLKVEVSQSCPEWVTSECDNVKCVLTTRVHCWLRGGTKVLIDKYSVRAISF